MNTEILKVTGMKFGGLFRLAQSSNTVEQFPPAHGVAGDPGMQAVALIASVPLDDRAWQPFVAGEVEVVAAGMVTHGSAAIRLHRD